MSSCDHDEVLEYLHLPAGSPLPETISTPRRVIVLVEQDVSDEWQDAVSAWIVESGCLYMMAWGQDCVSWDDSVDHANLRKFGFQDMPDDHFVMTTWHENEPLHEVFFHARCCAFHPTISLPHLTILDIRERARESEILALHRAESAGLLEDAFQDPNYLPFKDRLKILLRTR